MQPPDSTEERLSALCEALLEGFHVAAQPLTMIHAALSADCTTLLPEADLRELTETCSREADRLTRTFRSLKRLVQAYHFPPMLGSVDLAEIVKSRVPEGGTNADGQAIPVVMTLSPDLPPVTADRNATGDVLQTLVEAAAAHSDAVDPIEIHCSRSGDRVWLTMSSQNAALNRLPGELKIALPLASSRMELQSGSAVWRTSPFVVELSFAIAMNADENLR